MATESKKLVGFTIEEGNIIIARYLNWFHNNKKNSVWSWGVPHEYSFSVDTEYLCDDELRFHSDWSWLMKVFQFVQKQENYNITIYKDKCFVEYYGFTGHPDEKEDERIKDFEFGSDFLNLNIFNAIVTIINQINISKQEYGKYQSKGNRR